MNEKFYLWLMIYLMGLCSAFPLIKFLAKITRWYHNRKSDRQIEKLMGGPFTAEVRNYNDHEKNIQELISFHNKIHGGPLPYLDVPPDKVIPQAHATIVINFKNDDTQVLRKFCLYDGLNTYAKENSDAIKFLSVKIKTTDALNFEAVSKIFPYDDSLIKEEFEMHMRVQFQANVYQWGFRKSFPLSRLKESFVSLYPGDTISVMLFVSEIKVLI